MTTNSGGKKQCVTCNKSGGILTCDGCQKTFCGKHVIEHRQELAAKLDNIMQEHDLLQQEIEQPSARKNSLLQKIDRWEKDSILKIQIAAESARRSLLDLLDQAKGPLSKIGDFSEHDLDRWKKQLKDLELQVTFPPAAKLVPDKNNPIYLMQLHIDESLNNNSPNRKDTSSNQPNSTLQERFLQSLGPVRFEEGGFVARHTSPVSDYAYVRGRLLYLRGSHTIRFRLEKCKQPYYIFFGCMASKISLQEDAFRLPSAVGWFGSNQAYEQGRCSRSCKKTDFNSNKIQPNDVLQLTLDCNQMEVRLYHERMKSTCVLGVDPKLTPFPWQLLMVLCNPGDSVRILPNS
ncbi:hypothetical protein I4U23_019622 [Adineta vaga]|nr:hypothetical protein I4U23_019622 [Adineta vaga]